MDDLDLGDLVVDEPVHVQEQANLTMGDTCQAKWIKKGKKMPAELVAAGEFEEALGLLKRRLGIINADPLEPLFKEAYWATCSSLPTLPQAPSVHWPLVAEGSNIRNPMPLLYFQTSVIFDRVKEGHKLTTQGKFPDALTVFRAALQAIPLCVAKDKEEEQRLLEMIDMCREYVSMCRIEVARKGLDPTHALRSIELVAYMTCCKVQPAHLQLSLQLAMVTSFKSNNFVTAASFAKRLISGNFGSPEKMKDVLAKARQVNQVCEAKASDAHVIAFDPRAPVEDFKLCAGTMTPIKATDATVNCPFCGSTYHASQKGKLCETCQLAEIGANTLGIQLRSI